MFHIVHFHKIIEGQIVEYVDKPKRKSSRSMSNRNICLEFESDADVDLADLINDSGSDFEEQLKKQEESRR